ncbi:hypothetical protein [Flavobacterium sp. HNIBRBA15423]|uniref:hypothetical protein n=1 Tax=Flavobacterium sp. HNIBRBA15423 TaxID=3458683 RepID=UPI0040442D55
MIFQYFYSRFTVMNRSVRLILPSIIMTDIAVFYELKKSVLEHYKKRYLYFDGNWKNFSTQDILNLIDDVQEKTKNSVSEKWIYTHLKPQINEKLPRKDMLDIFSQYVGKAGWDEFKHTFISQGLQVEKETKNSSTTSRKAIYLVLGFLIFSVLLFVFWKWKTSSENLKTIYLEEKYSRDTIAAKSTKVYVVDDEIEKQILLKDSKVEVKENAKVIAKSPFYKEKTLDLRQNPETNNMILEPNDYVNILQGFIKSDIKDWKTRKVQLQKILHDNVEVIVMLKNNLGAEYFNKEEFSQKLIIPTASLKKMQIVEVKNDNTNKITFIRLIQE